MSGPQYLSTEASPQVRDPVIERYKRDVDWTLIEGNLRKTLDQRLAFLQGMEEFGTVVDQIRERARPATQFFELLAILASSKVDFIIIGGLAARLHGIARYTDDIDVVYSRQPDNLKRVIQALKPYSPYPRGAPPGLPFQWDVATLRNGLNFTLQTDLGWIDLLGELTGVGRYDELRSHTVSMTIHQVEYLCLDVDTLIQAKRAAGRPKDFEMIAELEIARELQSSMTRSNNKPQSDQ